MRRLLLLVAALVAGSLGYFFALLTPVERTHPRTVTVNVLPGETLGDISTDLQGLGLIRSAPAFEILVRLRGKARDLQAGPYRIETDNWAWEILDMMVRGDFQDTTITVPEGLWTTEVVRRVAPVVRGGEDSLHAVLADTLFLRRLEIPADSVEGYLFPDTYRLIVPTPAPALVRQMVRTFFQVWRKDMAARALETRQDLHEVVTLASIVEAEAQVPEERPRIAAVYLNRLERGLPLQADPTVIYALGERRSRTLYDDLKVPSPYNTYLHPGLPPGPIGNPGRDALKAVLWPLEPCEDLYFVARGDGTHLFATDYAGHLRNRRLVKQYQRQAEARESP